ncbi:hypothetical protein [Virgibacillus salexigens]|nr:hypothetical protein [Virgibacillus salexigens]
MNRSTLFMESNNLKISINFIVCKEHALMPSNPDATSYILTPLSGETIITDLLPYQIMNKNYLKK